MFGTVKNFLKSMLSEDFGSISFTRVTILVTMGTVLSTWVYKNIVTVGMVDFGTNAALVILTCMGAKVAHKFAEVAASVKEKELDLNSSKTEEE